MVTIIWGFSLMLATMTNGRMRMKITDMDMDMTMRALRV